MFDPKLQPGTELDNDELCSIFKCSPQGGMRKSNNTKSLVIISNHVKSIYDDRWDEETFHYTGMGISGDQSLGFRQNKTLSQSNVNGVSVHLFEVFVEKKYTYIGPVQLVADPYPESQPDQNDNERLVWMFPLKVITGQQPILAESTLTNLENRKLKAAKKLSDNELRAKGEKRLETKKRTKAHDLHSLH